MCLVIDACCLVKVFDPTNREHDRFVPVWEWINNGPGRMIYGGTKYLKELRQITRVLRLVAELSRKGRVKILAEASVDTLADEVKQQVNDSGFNDEHLVAIVIVSRCHVICTDDRQAMPYLKRSDLYARHNLERPRIYTKQSHKHLCCAANLVAT